MRKFKHVAIAGICCLAALAGGFWTQKDVATVSAEGTLTDLNTTENHFYMEPGAYVRVATNSSGIRFSTCVSDEWYQLATKDGATVEFHTVIDKYDNEDEGEEIDLTATHLTYDEKTKIHNFTGDIVYNDLTEEEKALAYNMQLEAYSYAVIKKAGEADVKISAQTNGVSRSMAEAADIALKAEAANGYADSDEGNFNIETEGVLNNYRIIKETTTYVEPTEGTLVMPQGFENATILKVNMADENDTYDVTAGTFTFDNDVATATEASDAYATVYTDKGIIETNFKVCTAIIKDATDWDRIFDNNSLIKGYYYLANDIEGYPTLNISKSGTASTAFSGVFDGAGRTVSFTSTGAYGIFAQIRDAVIKNTCFNLKIIRSASGQHIGFANRISGFNDFSDLYINIEEVTQGITGTFAPITKTFSDKSKFTRVVIKTPDGLTAENNKSATAFAYQIEKIDLNSGITTVGQDYDLYTDLYVISSLPLAVEAGYAKVAKWTVYAQNKMTDANQDGLITKEDIDTVNKITYWPVKVSEPAIKGLVWSFDSLAEMQTEAQAENSQLKLETYNSSELWNVTDGVLTWVGKN